MKMTKKTIILSISAGIFLITVLALTLYGILTHTEAGFMQVCWKDSLIHPSQTCSNPVPLQWSKSYPLTYAVTYNEYFPQQLTVKDLNIAIDTAANEINSRVGFTVLEPLSATEAACVIEPMDADILIKWGPPADRSAESTTFVGKDERILQAAILLRTPTTWTTLTYIMMHAFGHAALCLDHDNFTASIMYPSDPPTEPTIEVHFTDYDVKIVRERHKQANK
jgi:hypothetical protein